MIKLEEELLKISQEISEKYPNRKLKTKIAKVGEIMPDFSRSLKSYISLYKNGKLKWDWDYLIPYRNDLVLASIPLRKFIGSSCGLTGRSPFPNIDLLKKKRFTNLF